MPKPNGYVQAVCFSEARGKPKTNRGAGYFMENFGLNGDAHAGTGDRQASILLEQFVVPVTEQLGYKPAPGSFAENLLVGGLAEEDLKKGTVLAIGEAVVKIIAIGKENKAKHSYSFEGFSLLAEKGLFGQVLQSGRVETGDAVIILDK